MPDLYRVLLTEDGYTTVSEPVTRAAATADFDHYAPHGTPFSRSYLRVVAEDEYQRLRPALENANQVRTNVSSTPAVPCWRCGDEEQDHAAGDPRFGTTETNPTGGDSRG